ncbi:MAG: hypothetical protein JO351_04450, partial [Candidatus Eremiobacteraeota bacterium]|nr:hypothetical protein [Candidatus Eremiobacteraeota bacterium]
MRILRPIFALGVSALVAGCGSGTRGVTPSVAVNVPDTGTSGTLTFTITVPKKVNPKAKSYVSPASKGLWMNFTLGSHTTVQTFTLSKSSPGCTAKPGSLVCTISVSLAAGTYVSSIMVYDKPPFNGKFGKTAHVLSEEQNLKYRINGGKTTTIHPVLKGNDTSLKILNFPQGCVSGSFGPTAFTVAALDYDGYTIAGTYEASIALSDGDTSGNTTLAVSGPDNPPPDTLLSSLDTSTISWNGGALTNGGATITAAIRGFSTSATLWAGPADVLFYYTGSPAYLTVSPCAASSVTVWLWGAAGGSTYDQSVGAQGGYGGLVVATIPAVTGEQLTAGVGGIGSNGGSSAGLGGYNGGASGQLPPPSCKQSEFYCISGGGGGGGTDIRQGGSG